ncbi:DMT family transporter [Cellulophaga baltica]|uniref:DMT family transporter n=1 Tax=Cellulophaga TaxID=104264 RepID=UPI001C068752|nr:MULTISPECIES: DMT family transporter [Cellulophaga]MBU2998172.1 DMT family transporter [Cellulophaga baltica]MDO6769576.1 DMT family transporter [Cellulophaga sp. 1_MG-2023]
MTTKLKNYLHLHFIVFIWGFTAVLGKLISIDALPLVFYRMGIAVACIGLFIAFKKISLKISPKKIATMAIIGVVIALHWIAFFKAIKVSNVSIALATLATGAFFTALIEPFIYKRKMIWYEVAFGIVVIIGLYIIFNVETQYVEGIILALVAAFLASVFTLVNGKLITVEKPSIISFYELLFGFLFVAIYIGVQGGFTNNFFKVSLNDWMFIVILASVCTAYAFIASVKVMKFLSPYTVMLTVNLEPIYGIILAFIFVGESEKMNPLFYIGALIILSTVLSNGVLKNKGRIKKLSRT